MKNRKIIAIASSTGGPKALQNIIPKLPEKLGAPVIIVQHMPEGFTKGLAERLNNTSKLYVKEASDGEVLKCNCVYIAKGGIHFKVLYDGVSHRVCFSDEDIREGVKPCANYMFESLTESKYDEVICVVLTGMGADGSQGISRLSEFKKVSVIIQDQESSIVYGMPGSIVKNGIEHKVVSLDDIASEITKMLEG